MQRLLYAGDSCYTCKQNRIYYGATCTALETVSEHVLAQVQGLAPVQCSRFFSTTNALLGSFSESVCHDMERLSNGMPGSVLHYFVRCG
jgi:hypothetical protein